MKKTVFVVLAVLFLSSAGFDEKSDRFNYAIDTEKSSIEWSGATPNTSHQGSFSISSAGLEVVDGEILGGTFSIPIASIKNHDLARPVKPVLLKHLKGEDFFNMALHPEASFTLTKAEPLTDSVEGAVTGANTLITGNFTMIGNTHPISFPARIDFTDDGMAAEAVFKLDRTKWGMNHAADPELKNRHIYPEVDIHLKLSGIRK